MLNESSRRSKPRSSRSTRLARTNSAKRFEVLKVLYVGGRPKLIDQLKAFVAVRGGALIAHDGGIDDNFALLPGLVSQADVVYFPVDCISHAAAETKKSLGQRLCEALGAASLGEPGEFRVGDRGER